MNVRSRPTPWETRRTVKVEAGPPCRTRITTPWKVCVRSRSPSTTLALTRTVSPGLKSEMLGFSFSSTALLASIDPVLPQDEAVLVFFSPTAEVGDVGVLLQFNSAVGVHRSRPASGRSRPGLLQSHCFLKRPLLFFGQLLLDPAPLFVGQLPPG